MYAYVATRAGERNDFYEGAEFDKEKNQMVNPNVTQPREIAYWRKHPNLHGWMEQLWLSKGGSNEGSSFGSNFNGVELELTWEDIDELENAIKNRHLPATSGFFFGDDADDYYQEVDLKFIRDAKAELILGLKVFYNSSW